MSSRSVTDSLQINEVEAESGDCVSKLDYSGDSPSRPNSDITDVSLQLLHDFASIWLAFSFLVEILYVCVVLCIIHMYSDSVTLYYKNGLLSTHQNKFPRKHAILDFS